MDVACGGTAKMQQLPVNAEQTQRDPKLTVKRLIGDFCICLKSPTGNAEDVCRSAFPHTVFAFILNTGLGPEVRQGYRGSRISQLF
jgi:hypothetical protein